MANSNPDPQERLRQINRVWELRENHVPFREIAEELGCSVSTAHKLFKEGLQYNAPPGAEEERILTARQTDEALTRAWRLFERTNDPEVHIKILTAVARLLKEKRSLLGLDAAKKFQVVTTTSSALDQDIAQLLKEFGEFAAPGEARAEKHRQDRLGRLQR